MKRAICALLILGMILSALPLAAEATGVESQISPAFLHYMQEKFPEGKYWNHEPGQPNDPDGWTDKPCTHHASGICDFADGNCGCNVFDGCIQCQGFAAKLANEFTGTMLHTWKKTYTAENIKVGDVVRINNDHHSIFITAIRGEEITYADCNLASDCRIRWDTKMTRKALEAIVTYVQVAPVSTAVPAQPTVSWREHIKLGERAELSWRPLPNAEEYRLSIWLNGTFLRTETMTENSFYSFRPEMYGEYTYELTAVNPYGASSPALCKMLVDPHDCQIKYFTDVKNFMDWSHAGIEYVVVNGLFKGTGETTFAPDTTMTRGMIATVLWRMKDSPDVLIENPYSDVAEGEWYEDAVRWAYENGIMDGVGGGRFDPDGMLTREQIVTVLYRFSGAAEYALTDHDMLSAFADASEVAAWSKDAVCWAVANQVIQGSTVEGEQYLLPSGGATRAQVATILMRFLEDIS